jgi:hypothetical protein
MASTPFPVMTRFGFSPPRNQSIWSFPHLAITRCRVLSARNVPVGGSTPGRARFPDGTVPAGHYSWIAPWSTLRGFEQEAYVEMDPGGPSRIHPLPSPISHSQRSPAPPPPASTTIEISRESEFCTGRRLERQRQDPREPGACARCTGPPRIGRSNGGLTLSRTFRT